MTSFEGDTGPYLQYAHARLCSMMRKSGLSEEDLLSANFDLLTERHAVDLIRMLSQYSDVLANTLKTLEPITVLSYLFKMTHALSSSYDILKVIGSEPEVKKARMALYAAARQVLHNGMRVLGLSPVERFVSLFHMPSPLSSVLNLLSIPCRSINLYRVALANYFLSQDVIRILPYSYDFLFSALFQQPSGSMISHSSYRCIRRLELANKISHISSAWTITSWVVLNKSWPSGSWK